MGVPVGVVDDDGVRGRQVQAETSGAGGQQHHEALELGAVEPLDRRGAHVGPRVAVEPFVLVAWPISVHTALKKVLQRAGRAKGKGGMAARRRR